MKAQAAGPAAKAGGKAASSPASAHLRVGAAHDAVEREADRVADAVMRGRGAWSSPSAPVDRSRSVRRACAACSTSATPCASCDEEDKLRRSLAGGGFDNAAAPAAVARVLDGGGRPLGAAARAFIEPRFGFDFAAVRIHDDAAAAASAAEIGARAYTHGNHIVFGAGQFAPSTSGGMRLLAHELAHVVQQEGGGARLVRRQSEEDLPPPPNKPAPKTGADLLEENPLITKDAPDPAEPNCPKAPTNLGNLQPSPPCSADLPEAGDDSPRFRFCEDSDTFIASERARLRALVAGLDSKTTFEVHGYASKDAPGATQAERDRYNVNLSCHRAKRLARELVNGGVLESNIEIAAHGGTERFGAGEKNPDDRVVQLAFDEPGRQTPDIAKDPKRGDLEAVVEAARQRLIRGEYHVSADAYVQRWSCGHFHTLSEMVARSTIKIDHSLGLTEQGSISTVGVNTILVSDKVADTDNMYECASNRIADLAFHHLARPNVPYSIDQHQMALHMLSLAGIPACSITDVPGLPSTRREFDTPRADDPQAGQAPLCADDPLRGPTTKQEIAQGTAHPPPTFTLGALQVDTKLGTPVPQSDGFRLEANPPDDPSLMVTGIVTVAGDKKEIPNWQVGLLQTVESSDTFIEYVSGAKIRERLPLPLRDGPRADNKDSSPPWFARDARVDAHPGDVGVMLQDSPNLNGFATFIDLNQIRFVRSTPIDKSDPQKGAVETPTFSPATPSALDVRDVASKGHRRVVFNTWLAARRKDAPLSRFSTTFIAGKKIDYRLEFDFIFRGRSNPDGTGSLAIKSTDATDADASTMQLRGATPADFTRAKGAPLFNEFLVSEPAPSIDQAGGTTSLFDLLRNVERRVTPIRRRLGFTQPLTVFIKFDLGTGEIILDRDTLDKEAVSVANNDNTKPPLTDAQRLQLAEEIFFELRGKVVIGRLSPNQGSTGAIKLSFHQPALP